MNTFLSNYYSLYSISDLRTTIIPFISSSIVFLHHAFVPNPCAPAFSLLCALLLKELIFRIEQKEPKTVVMKHLYIRLYFPGCVVYFGDEYILRSTGATNSTLLPKLSQFMHNKDEAMRWKNGQKSNKFVCFISPFLIFNLARTQHQLLCLVFFSN